MITILRFILFILLAPAFAIVAQAAGTVQDDFRIVDAGSPPGLVVLGGIDSGICNYDVSGALLKQRRSIDGKAANEDGLNGVGELEAHEAAQPLLAFLSELVAANKTPLLKSLADSTVDDALRAGQQLDRNGLTVAGRALQKHGDRAGSAFPASTGNAAARNAQGQQVLQDILRSPQQTVNLNRFGGQDIFDSVTGRGVRFGGNGNMMGFLEP